MNYLRGYNSRVKWEQENGIQPDESLQEAKKIVDDQYRIVVRAKQYYYGEEEGKRYPLTMSPSEFNGYKDTRSVDQYQQAMLDVDEVDFEKMKRIHDNVVL